MLTVEDFITVGVQEPVGRLIRFIKFRFQTFAFLFRVVLSGCGQAGLELRFQLLEVLHQAGDDLPDYILQHRQRYVPGRAPLPPEMGFRLLQT